ncbi:MULTISPECIES: Bug family tripartite tricarboxylate transporter substrate binding protein [unclassified Cupriavidus]|uniref:Bug family tripartite tricarboxylate transporter substrate binding protein n=1 Tax=unclassified Cupriavidus TaxID=2640874 RepID=UPI0008842787|nr:tripartite tricarboxylate transporter substrate binding protein [Cupriavidus sp. YR651]SDC68372.1 Tripartite-type tricarboxylate transporter, receptor component TctC [Cupriavidus sp. YR651]
MNSTRRTLIKASAMLLAVPGLADAQDTFPNKPLRYVVPVAAGGGSDLIGRTVADRWGRVLGQSMVVENQAGGGGVIACQMTAKASPDGYSLMQGYVATHGTNPATRKVPYDPVKDFTPIGMIGGTPNVLVVNSALPVANLKEFIEYARKQPVAYGSAGPGSLTHLTMELLAQQLDLKMTHAAYRGIAPAFNDLIGGQTQAMFPGLSAALPHIRSGRARALAVTGHARHPLLKNTPTLEETGLKGFDAMQWYGVVGPAGMPADVVARLNSSLNTVLKSPDLADKLSSEALQPTPMTPDQFRRYIADEVNRWRQLARDRGIRLDT